MPGIIDTHSHTAIEGSVNECTDVITAETRVRDVIDQHDVSIYRQLAGGVTAINVLHGSCNAIGGQNAVLKLRWGKGPEELVFKEAPRGIKFALGENVKRSNFRGPGEPRYPGTRMGVEVVLREAFLRARAYKKEWAEYEAKLKGLPAKAEKPVAPRRDLRLETLAEILDGKILVHSHGYRADEMLMLMSVADEFGFKVRTFQHGLEAYKIASEIARHGAGVGTFIDWWAYKIEAIGASPYNPAILAQQGRAGLAQLGLGRARAAALLGRREGGQVRRGERGGGAAHDHAERGVAARGRPLRGLARGRQAGRHRDLERPPALAPGALRDDARGRAGLLRPRERHGGSPGDRRVGTAGARAWAREVRDEGASRRIAAGRRRPAARSSALAQDVPLAIRGARIVTVAGPVIEKGTVVVQGAASSRSGPTCAVPAGATVDRRIRQDALPRAGRRAHDGRAGRGGERARDASTRPRSAT